MSGVSLRLEFGALICAHVPYLRGVLPSLKRVVPLVSAD